MRTLRFLITMLLVVLIPVSLVSAASTRPSTASCSTKGLRFTYKSGGATFSEKVVNLKATGTKCRVARKVAGTVAKALLHNRKLPKKIAGFRVKVSACSQCTPRTDVTATRRGGKITFTGLGGA